VKDNSVVIYLAAVTGWDSTVEAKELFKTGVIGGVEVL